jgi:hypothetical protein
MTKSNKNTKNVKTIAMATVAAALAGTLSMGTALPALAEEAAPDQSQQPIVAQDDATADEGAWDATADESGFAADATTTYAPELGATQDDLAGTDGNGWWWRRVSPTDALQSAEGYFGIYGYDDWDFQVGRFQGIPAYRVEIDVDSDWHGPCPYVWGQDGNATDDAEGNGVGCGRHGGWQPWGGTTRYVAFVNYFTGQVMGAYVDYE